MLSEYIDHHLMIFHSEVVDGNVEMLHYVQVVDEEHEKVSSL